MAVMAMNHFTILTDDVAGTTRFYADVLGLHAGPKSQLRLPRRAALCRQGSHPACHRRTAEE
ncbi:MAG: hypothetical protein E6H66_18615 [Betaproteobacteria bacterium]|nr:MAG: hypothetical protein E6H66_18615 [Betaproteobacteria bacterium]